MVERQRKADEKAEKNRECRLKRQMGDRGARPQVGRGVTGASRKAINVAQVFATEAIHALTVRGNGSDEAKTRRERRDRRGRIAHAPAPVARESADPGRRDASCGHVGHELRCAAHGIGGAVSGGSGDTRDTARRVARGRGGRHRRRGSGGRGVHTRVMRADASGELQNGHQSSVAPKVGGGCAQPAGGGVRGDLRQQGSDRGARGRQGGARAAKQHVLEGLGQEAVVSAGNRRAEITSTLVSKETVELGSGRRLVLHAAALIVLAAPQAVARAEEAARCSAVREKPVGLHVRGILVRGG